MRYLKTSSNYYQVKKTVLLHFSFVIVAFLSTLTFASADQREINGIVHIGSREAPAIDLKRPGETGKVKVLRNSNNGFDTASHNQVVADKGNIEIENAEFKFIIDNKGRAISLIHKASGQECLAPDGDAPLFAVTQYTPYDNELQLIYPAKAKTFAANSVTRNGDDLVITFDLINIIATIGLKITDDYIGFSLKKIGYNIPRFGDQRKTQVDEFTILQLPIRNRSHFGEWLNVAWDDEVAINLLATDPFAKIDAAKNKNYHLLQATALPEIKALGVGAALIVTKKDNLLNCIDQVEKDYNLPLGVASRRSSQYKYSYLEPRNVNVKNIDEYIEYAKKGGFRAMQIWWSDFAKTAGHFPWRPEYPERYV